MKKFTLATVLAALCVAIGSAAEKAPKYIFYCIGDGMGFGAASLTEAFNRMVLGNDTSITMLQFPVASAATTHSASSGVTDSAAAGTALATGSKTKNGMLGMNADTVAVTSIATQLKDLGYGVGLITTVAPDDATPGAFYAHVPHRSMYYEIGCQAAQSGFDFIGGANLRGLVDKDGNPTDLPEVFDRNGMSVVRGTEAIASAKYPRIMLLNTSTENDNEVGLRIDSLDDVLTLPMMTEACIDFLSRKSPDKFFIMIEGGSIDHAGHANDAPTLVRETLGFNEALDVALKFYRQHPDETLIVVTADHETGGLALANRSMGYRIEPKYLQYPAISKDRFMREMMALSHSRMVIDWPYMRDYLAENLRLYNELPVSDADNEAMRTKFQAVLDRRAEGDMEGAKGALEVFSAEVWDVINRLTGTGWTTNDHSGAMVPVFAVGVGAEEFAPMHDNTQLPEIIRELTGITK